MVRLLHDCNYVLMCKSFTPIKYRTLKNLAYIASTTVKSIEVKYTRATDNSVLWGIGDCNSSCRLYGRPVLFTLYTCLLMTNDLYNLAGWIAIVSSNERRVRPGFWLPSVSLYGYFLGKPRLTHPSHSYPFYYIDCCPNLEMTNSESA